MLPLPRRRRRAPTSSSSAPPSAREMIISLVFKLISFGMIACFVEILLGEGHPVVVAVFAAAATAVSAGIAGMAPRSRRGWPSLN